MTKQLLGRLFLALAVCLMTASLFGQFTDANLVGIVTDSTGAAVPGAAVTLTNKDTGVTATTTTATTGEYRFNNVPVGANYQVSAAAKGFTTATVAGVALELNHTASVNLTLAVGTVSTTVEVTEATAPIDTTSSQLQTTYNTMQLTDLGAGGISKNADGSGIYNLSLLGAGVASQGGVGQGVGPSVAGQRPENNTFMIDGVPNNSGYSTGPEEYISNEVVAEFNIVQNQFSAEFGGASGGVFNVIVKSGTNSLHGSIYEYFQNRDLNAVDYQTVVAGNRSNPRFDSNRLGATVGGPIVKNKLFYFGSYEYIPTGKASVPSSPVDAPTQAGIALLNGMSGLSKNNLSAFEKYVPVTTTVDPNNPSTTVNGVSIPLGAVAFASPNFSNAYHATIAIDYNISEKDQLRGRWIYDNYSAIDNAAQLPVFYGTNPNYNNAGSISEFHSFSPTLLNEFRVAFRHFYGNLTVPSITFPGLNVFPNLTFDDLGLQLGPDSNAPGGSISDTSSLQDNLTKTWGKHTFKMGYTIVDSIIDGTFVQRARGDYDYANLQQFLLDQQPSGGNLSGVMGERSGGAGTGVPFGFLQNAAYFQDDWRVTHRLTLNLGVRYEYVTVPVGSRAQALSSLASVPGVITFAEPKAGTNDWSPRLGFAFTPDSNGKWVVRGGVGRAFDNTYINLNQNASPPFYQTTEDVNPTNPVSNFLANGGLSGTPPPLPTTPAAARALVASYTFDQTRPYALIGTIGVQHLLGNDYTLEARYTYTKGVHLWNQTRLNIVAPVTAANALPTFFSMPSASVLAGLTNTLGYLETLPRNDLAQDGFPNNIVGYHPWGNSRYNGLALQMNKRYSKNFSYIAAYTWSQNFDDSTATNFSTILSPRRAQDFQNMRAEWADSALDRRQRFTLTPIYDFRPFRGGNWLMKNVVGNWNVAGTYTFQSPEYATVQSGVDSNLNGDNAGDRSITNVAGAANVGTNVIGLTSTGQQVAAGSANIVAYVAQNPNARYVVAGLGALSNTGRNTLPLGRTNNIDAAITKRFSITERFIMSFSLQAANVFNHSQFTGGYLSDVGFYNTASINRAFLVPSNSSFDQYNFFLPSNSRQVSLVAHFVF